MRGRLYTACINRLRDVPPCDIQWFAVRVSESTPRGWAHNVHLCPSEELLHWAKRLERQGQWNPTTFQEYTTRFWKEIEASSEAKSDLTTILNALSAGQDVAVSCYCANPHMCHRGLIAQFVEEHGFAIVHK